jgi:hypothetical protein
MGEKGEGKPHQFERRPIAVLNNVTLIGFVSRPPRRFGDIVFFPLAVYRDPDRDDGRRKAEGQKDTPDFPPVVVRVEDMRLPSFVKHKAPIRVEGWLRTRNRTEPLAKRVRKDLVRAGMKPQQAQSVTDLIPENLQSRTVEVEVIAERIWPEGGRPIQHADEH